jgi:hypothetical protein
LDVGLPGAAVAGSIDELFDAIGRVSAHNGEWVVKAEFSNSSRERFLQRSNSPPDRGALSRWAARRLAMGQALIVEPWVERIDEVGVQLTIQRNGEPRVEGVTGLLVDNAGRYRGSEFTPALDNDPQWQDAIAIAMEAARHVQQAGYFGPLGIDAMRYRDAAGEIRLRPLQDINARWTMGRLSLGLRRLLHPGERGYWLHGAGAQRPVDDNLDQTQRIREFATSPESIGGKPVRLRSTVRLVGPS